MRQPPPEGDKESRRKLALRNAVFTRSLLEFASDEGLKDMLGALADLYEAEAASLYEDGSSSPSQDPVTLKLKES